MEVTKQIKQGTLTVPAAGGDITAELSITANKKGAPETIEAGFWRHTEKESKYAGNAQAWPNGAVNVYFNSEAQLADDAKKALFEAVLKEAAAAFGAKPESKK